MSLKGAAQGPAPGELEALDWTEVSRCRNPPELPACPPALQVPDLSVPAHHSGNKVLKYIFLHQYPTGPFLWRGQSNRGTTTRRCSRARLGLEGSSAGKMEAQDVVGYSPSGRRSLGGAGARAQSLDTHQPWEVRTRVPAGTMLAAVVQLPAGPRDRASVSDRVKTIIIQTSPWS